MPTGTYPAYRLTQTHTRLRASRTVALLGGCVALNAAVFGRALLNLESDAESAATTLWALLFSAGIGLLCLLGWIVAGIRQHVPLRAIADNLLWPLLIYGVALLPFAFVPYHSHMQLAAGLLFSALIAFGLRRTRRPMMPQHYFSTPSQRRS